MKSSGFNIEDSHLRDINRIARLTAMVCIALAWAYLVGEHKDINVKAIRILKHGKRAKSLIKYGLEEIANVLLRPLYKPIFDVFIFLSCTYLHFTNNMDCLSVWNRIIITYILVLIFSYILKQYCCPYIQNLIVKIACVNREK